MQLVIEALLVDPTQSDLRPGNLLAGHTPLARYKGQ